MTASSTYLSHVLPQTRTCCAYHGRKTKLGCCDAHVSLYGVNMCFLQLQWCLADAHALISVCMAQTCVLQLQRWLADAHVMMSACMAQTCTLQCQWWLADAHVMMSACMAQTCVSAPAVVAGRCGCAWARSCCQSLTCFFLMSPPITWIWMPSNGLKVRHIALLSLPFCCPLLPFASLLQSFAPLLLPVVSNCFCPDVVPWLVSRTCAVPSLLRSFAALCFSVAVFCFPSAACYVMTLSVLVSAPGLKAGHVLDA